MIRKITGSMIILGLLSTSCKQTSLDKPTSASGKKAADSSKSLNPVPVPIPNLGQAPAPSQPGTVPGPEVSTLPSSTPAPSPEVGKPAVLEAETEALKQAGILRVPIAKGKNLAYVSNRDLTKAAQAIETVVVIVHGIDRNPAVYYDSIHASLLAHPGPNSLSAQTWIIAPYFMQAEDKPLVSDLTWIDGDWKEGNAAQGYSDASMSSFAALDTILKALDNPARFSKLRTIILVGFSAGGQFMQRYTLGTKVPEELTRFNFRFVVGSPGSYMYISPDRMKAGGTGGFAPPNSANCPDYDSYRYGLKNRVAYLMASTGVEMMARLKARTIRFIAGNADTSRGGVLDVTCAGDLQGANRFARSQKFVEYARFLGAGDHLKAYVVPNAAHDHSKVFGSAEGQSSLFDP